MEYRVLVGIDYNGNRAEPGDVVANLPKRHVASLRALGVIEPVGADARSRAEEEAAE